MHLGKIPVAGGGQYPVPKSQSIPQCRDPRGRRRTSYSAAQHRLANHEKKGQRLSQTSPTYALLKVQVVPWTPHDTPTWLAAHKLLLNIMLEHMEWQKEMWRHAILRNFTKIYAHLRNATYSFSDLILHISVQPPYSILQIQIPAFYPYIWN